MQGLGKRYRLGTSGDALPTLRDSISRLGRREPRPERDEGFWALRDISFDVMPGEVLGIVGNNGAGKSTLLKIMSRIVEPTEGSIVVRGRLGALLEVGTGFHPELTGRENIYLNGSILGMSHANVRARLDEIVDFSGVGKFLDTPVKRYSSGMHLRLAFAVAAFIDTDILIVDEVLAVGDVEFQRKCIGKIGDIASSGRTVLFVSHQLATVQRLTSRTILLHRGAIVADGPPDQVIARYLKDMDASADLALPQNRVGRGAVRINSATVVSEDGVAIVGRPAALRFGVVGEESAYCAFTIYDEWGQAVVSLDSEEHVVGDELGSYFECHFPELLLRPGRYRVHAGLYSPGGVVEDHIEGALVFDVHEGAFQGRSVSALRGQGPVTFPHHWVRPGA
ncbi:ABC transporter ATP-binding protein [Devosia sp. CN2-171]|uniref:ABC transporter ATP-binding protein n=1 Tax=Devosia sp. CN2-171 TaxID=3400909 RepID=UPI003BF8BDB5